MSQKQKTTKAIIYARFSPRRNAEECESIETQEYYCRQYCEKHGYEVVEVFSDPDVSGSDEDRPILWSAVDAIKRGYVLVVYKTDRLARGVYLDEAIRRMIAKQGGLIEAVEGSTNGTRPEDDLIRQVLAAFAEYERKVIAARTRAAMRRHQSSGRAMSKHAPFGWREGEPEQVSDPTTGKVKVRRRLEIDDAEQEVIRFVMGLHREGTPMRAIARAVAAKGYKPRGAEWNHHLIRSIIDRESR